MPRSSIRFRPLVLPAITLLVGVSSTAGAYTALPFDPPAFVLDAGEPAFNVLTGDVDGDGMADIVTFKPGTVVQFGSALPGIGSVVQVDTWGPNEFAEGATLRDLDGDGASEILACTDTNSGTVLRIWRCLPGRNFQIAREIPANESVTTGDFDADGDIDIAGGDNARVRIYRNDGDWVFPAAVDIAFPVSQGGEIRDELVSGDFDGDGRDDLARGCRVENGGPKTIRIARFVGTGFPYNTFTTPALATGTLALLAVDLDADGSDDLVRIDSQGTKLEFWQNGPGGMLVAHGSIPLPQDLRCLDAGRLDGDALPDVVVGAATTRSLISLRNLGGFAFAEPQSRPAGGEPSDLAWYDLDVDGRLEPLISNGLGVPLVVHPAEAVAPPPSFAVAGFPTA